MFSDNDRHKKARRACTMRAFVLNRTYPDHYLVELAELNPRPKFLHPRYYMLSLSLHSHASCGQTRH